MIVHLYAILWNEERTLRFFFRHYAPFVDRFVLFDDGSDDGTREIVAAEPKAELRPFIRSDPNSFVASEEACHNTCWQESRGRADWVIVTDADEHLYHPDLDGHLRACRAAGVTLVPALGFEMVSDGFPAPDETLSETRRMGAPSRLYSKLRLFDPDALVEIELLGGGHVARPKGRVVLPRRDELRLLHYKNLGIDYVVERRAALAARLGARDIAEGWGYHYRSTRAQVAEEVAAHKARLVDALDPGLDLERFAGECAWWRHGPFATVAPDGRPPT